MDRHPNFRGSWKKQNIWIHSSLSSGWGLFALVDNLHWEMDRENASLLALLGISVAFNAIEHGVLMGWLAQFLFVGTNLQWF